ncbi:3136_t:CDS:10 [Entrophospora sp. SA101]|nr:3136_t:CDS:10 [Entrophospora sp. SA101]
MAQKIIASKTGEKTPKDKEINISSWYQYDTIQRTSEVNDEIWTFNDMKNALPSTCQYKIKSAANANTGEKFIIPQQISAVNIGDWNTEGCESTEDWSNTEQKKILTANIRDWAPLWMNDFRQVERVKKSTEKVGQIRYKSEDERMLSYCDNKWQELLGRESLIKYLESEKGLVEQREFFRKKCNKCHKRKTITSFCLYTSVMDVEENQESPTVEIICHLAWNKHYRVFGNWKCLNCEKKWKCKRCKEDDENKSTIYKYEPLVLSDGDGPHKSHLCAKCQNKEYCTRTGTYFGSR